MQQLVSKSQFKAQVLEFLRNVEQEHKPLIITHAGKPVVKISPYSEDESALLKTLRNTVIRYSKPTESVDEATWEVLS